MLGTFLAEQANIPQRGKREGTSHISSLNIFCSPQVRNESGQVYVPVSFLHSSEITPTAMLTVHHRELSKVSVRVSVCAV